MPFPSRSALRTPLRTAVPLLLAGCALGAVPGVPTPPRPGPLPALWAGWSNDAFGGEIGDNADDYRTNSLGAAALIDGVWLIAVDHGILTNRGTEIRDPGRIDELTVTVGRLVAPDVAVDRHNRLMASGGIGVRVAGDLGGAEVQNALHRRLGYRELDLAYDDGGIEGVAYVSGSWLWLERFPFSMPAASFIEQGQVGFSTQVGALGSTGGELQAEIGVALTVVGFDGAAWVGPRFRWNAGEASTPTAEAVADREDGLWLAYGVSAGGWFIDGGFNIEDQTTVGQVGWMWGRRPGRSDQARLALVEGDVGVSAGLALATQVRWQPAWLARLGALGSRAALFIDYRFGLVPDVDFGTDSPLTYRQPLVGMELAWQRPRPGLRLVPFVQAGLGVRHEFTAERGPDPRFPDQRATTGVVQGSAGMRLTWGPAIGRGRSVRYGLGVAYDGWLPFTRATARNGGDSEQFLLPGSGPSAQLSAAIAW